MPNVLPIVAMTSFCSQALLVCLLLGTTTYCSHRQSIEEQSLTPMNQVEPSDSNQTMSSTYQTDCQKAIADLQQQFQQLAAFRSPTTDTLLFAINRFLSKADSVRNGAALYRQVHPDVSIRQAATLCEQSIEQLLQRFYLEPAVFQSLSQLKKESLDDETLYFLEKLLKSFKRSGVHLPIEQRQQIAVLQEELLQLGQLFEENIAEDQKSVWLFPKQLEGLPKDYLQQHPLSSDGKVKITTDYPDYYPLMMYAKDDDVRKQLYLLFRQRGYPENNKILASILQKRYQLADLLGFASWADYSMDDKMAGTTQEVLNFLQHVQGMIQPRVNEDRQALLHLQRLSDPQSANVEDWQKAYLEEQLKKQLYHFDSLQLRPYFALHRVKSGLMHLTAQMFGLRYEKINDTTWHEDVEVYAVYDAEHERLLGRFYLDLHPREQKYGHAAMFPLHSGISQYANETADGMESLLPEAVLVCNFSKGGEALMLHEEVQTLFHEFGHLLHHLLAGQHRWILHSGIQTEWDFVEVPSQLLEEWSYDTITLQSFAQNKSGQILPESTIHQLQKLRAVGLGLWAQQQLFYSTLSLQLHLKPYSAEEIHPLAEALQKSYSPFPYVVGSYFELSFGHLNGYSAIYYTYMWSLAIAKDLFSVFESQGLHHRATSYRYRDMILKPGGSKPAKILLSNFLQRPYDWRAFDRYLNTRPNENLNKLNHSKKPAKMFKKVPKP